MRASKERHVCGSTEHTHHQQPTPHAQSCCRTGEARTFSTMSNILPIPFIDPDGNNQLIGTYCLHDDNLTWADRGLLTYLLAQKPNWEMSIKKLMEMGGCGRHVVYKSLNNLRRCGYVRRIAIKGSEGHISTWLFVVFSLPVLETEKQVKSLLTEIQEVGAGLASLLTEIQEVVQKTPSPWLPTGYTQPLTENQEVALKELINIYMSESSTNISDSVIFLRKECKPLAKKLADIIQSHKSIKVSGPKLTSWAKEIQRLCQKDEVSLDRIQSALAWYADAVGGEYIPVVESGRALRNKFMKLEAAMERDGCLRADTKTATKKQNKIRVGH